MRPCQNVHCPHLACPDVRPECFQVPDVEIRPKHVSIILISEAAPADPAEGYYAPGEPLFAATTLQAFADAGLKAASVRDLTRAGIYLTTAVKCAKTSYGIKTETIKACSHLLERELALFPNAKVLLLMGDVAITAMNAIAQRAGEARVIPAGATYRLRGGEYFHRGRRVFPSYLQAGPAFFIEKSKRKMIAEDLTAALRA